MTWTDKDTELLLDLKTNMDSDDVRIKEKIKEILLNNRILLHVIDNKELEANLEDDGTGADEYFGRNILPYYLINPVQHAAESYVCYEVSYNNNDRASRVGLASKELLINFQILSNYKVLINQETGIAKHDLLAAIIVDQFNFSNYFGETICLISSVPSVVDNDFACRTLTFKQTTDNTLVKTIDGVQRFANKITGMHFK